MIWRVFYDMYVWKTFPNGKLKLRLRVEKLIIAELLVPKVKLLAYIFSYKNFQEKKSHRKGANLLHEPSALGG